MPWYPSMVIGAAVKDALPSIDDLVGALNRASVSSERHARRLVVATWALALATGGLILATILRH